MQLDQSQVDGSHTAQTTESIRSVADALITSPYLQMQQRDDNSLLLEFPEIQAFSFDGASLSQELQAALTDVAGASIQNTHLNIEVIGHTDNIGNPDYNQALSENRARQVADFLNQQGIQMSRIQVTGMGQEAPIANNRTAEGRAANRRVELIISE
ncbi:OmpA family protein [Nitrincola sp. A-D6]|uniref:OmpA family protein n=1 Tax=Nitrincola sp. A-D6 TaxID=1545442 RepID=UPI00068BD2C8|nr:OmpA family protein [Nitrincola sp. A-D6]